MLAHEKNHLGSRQRGKNDRRPCGRQEYGIYQELKYFRKWLERRKQARNVMMEMAGRGYAEWK